MNENCMSCRLCNLLISNRSKQEVELHFIFSGCWIEAQITMLVWNNTTGWMKHWHHVENKQRWIWTLHNENKWQPKQKRKRYFLEQLTSFIYWIYRRPFKKENQWKDPVIYTTICSVIFSMKSSLRLHSYWSRWSAYVASLCKLGNCDVKGG